MAISTLPAWNIVRDAPSWSATSFCSFTWSVRRQVATPDAPAAGIVPRPGVEGSCARETSANVRPQATGFDAIVTSAKGTWVRVAQPPVEGKVVRGAAGLDVGDRVRVELLSTDVERGFIDFARAGEAP